MIAMLDRDYSGKMGFNEFKELWAALNQWKVFTCTDCVDIAHTLTYTYQSTLWQTVCVDELHRVLAFIREMYTVQCVQGAYCQVELEEHPLTVLC